MEYRRMGQSGLKVSELCLGTMTFGHGADEAEARRMVDLALAAGYVLDFSFKQGKTPWPWRREAGPIDRLFIKGGDNNLDLMLHLTRGASRLF